MHYCFLILVLLATIPHPTSPIINGKTDRVGNHAWHVIVYCFNSLVTHYCGGTLVSRKHVVTAGSCKIADTSCLVFAGGVYTNSSDAEAREPVMTFDVHPNYLSGGADSRAYDVGLITLFRNLHRSDRMQPVHLKDNNTLLIANQDAIMTGNGRGRNNEDLAKRQYAEGITPFYICSGRAGVKPPSERWTNRYCITFNNSEAGTLNDAGNGLVVQGHLLVGVLSLDVDKAFCGDTCVFNFFTMMSVVKKWLKETIMNDCTTYCSKQL